MNYHYVNFQGEKSLICEEINIFGMLRSICPAQSVIDKARAEGCKYFVAHIFASKGGQDYGWYYIDINDIKGENVNAEGEKQYVIKYAEVMTKMDNYIEVAVKKPPTNTSRVQQCADIADSIIDTIEEKLKVVATNLERVTIKQRIIQNLTIDTMVLLEKNVNNL